MTPHVLPERLARLARPTLAPADVVTSPGRCLAILLCYELRLPLPTRAFFASIR
jgi:hypothetical protein